MFKKGQPAWNKGLTKETDDRVLNQSKSQIGRKSWNKGLTKETDIRVLKNSSNMQKTIRQQLKDGTLKGCCTKDYHGTQAHIESSAKGGGYHKNLGRGKKGYYKNIWCDSSWELAFVIYHLEHNIQFERNWKKFPYIFEDKEYSYIPDFIYPDGTYIEVKGYLDERSLAKAEQFKYKLKILQADEMKPILEYVAKELPKAVMNLMGQFRPQYKAFNYEEINRRPTSEEMREVKMYAKKLGILFEPVS